MDNKIDKIFNISKRKSINKSSYKYGRRRSRSLASVISADLANIIDTTLAPSERLKILIQYSLQNAFHIAEREVSSDIDSNKLAEYTADCISNIDKDLEKQNLYAISIDGDKSFAVQESFAEFNKELDKLDEECRLWDELILKENEALKTVKKDTPSITLENIPDCNQLKSMDYSNIAEKCAEVGSNYLFQVKKVKKFSDEIERFADMTKLYNKFLNEKIANDFSKTIPESPRTLVKKFCQKT